MTEDQQEEQLTDKDIDKLNVEWLQAKDALPRRLADINHPEHIKSIRDYFNDKCDRLQYQEAIDYLYALSHRKPDVCLSLADKIMEYVRDTRGVFSLQMCDKELEIVTQRDKANRRQILHRLIEQGMLVPDSKRYGYYRRVEGEVEQMHWQTATGEPLNLLFPLGEEQLINIYSTNIIIISGSQNAGKTCYVLNFIKLNMNNYKINYYNSEMGSQELKLRLSKFDIPLDEWKFNAYERSSNFADVINNKVITVIDYLEVLENFYEVGKLIFEIHERLKGGKGIAIIALQKAPSVKDGRGKLIFKDLGRGGSFSSEKPRLYMALEHGMAKIVKAKNWRDGAINPNGKVINYKIYNGAQMTPQGIWHEWGDDIAERKLY